MGNFIFHTCEQDRKWFKTHIFDQVRNLPPQDVDKLTMLLKNADEYNNKIEAKFKQSIEKQLNDFDKNINLTQISKSNLEIDNF